MLISLGIVLVIGLVLTVIYREQIFADDPIPEPENNCPNSGVGCGVINLQGTWDSDEKNITISWQKPPGGAENFSGYLIKKGSTKEYSGSSGIGGPDNFDVNSFIDNDINENYTYYYWVITLYEDDSKNAGRFFSGPVKVTASGNSQSPPEFSSDATDIKVGDFSHIKC